MSNFQRIKFLFQFCQDINAKLLKLCLLNSLLTTLQPFLVLYFVASLIRVLSSGVSVGQFLYKISIMFIILGLVKVISIFITYSYNINLNLSGIESGNYFAKQLMTMSYDKFESSALRDKQVAAQHYLYVGGLVDETIGPLVSALIAIGIYGVVIARLSVVLLISISFCILIKYFLLRKKAELKRQFERDEALFMRRQDVLFSISTSLDWAKDI